MRTFFSLQQNHLENQHFKTVMSNGKNLAKVLSSSALLEEEKCDLEQEHEDEASLFLVALCANNVSCVNNNL